MLLIREFESMLQSIKTQGSYEGIEYDHKGPAPFHRTGSSAVVRHSFWMSMTIFGSHRSHGEILAKGMSSTVSLMMIAYLPL